MKRQRHFRGVLVRLECEHTAVLPTSWWRLSAALVAVTLGYALRRGVWCVECKAFCHPLQYLKTCRI